MLYKLKNSETILCWKRIGTENRKEFTEKTGGTEMGVSNFLMFFLTNIVDIEF